MRRKIGLVAAAVTVGLLAISCGGSATTKTPAKSPATTPASTAVVVQLSDFAIAAPPTATAGSITFTATNNGPAEHEMVVLRTDDEADAIPVADGRIDEEGEGVENVGEIGDFAVGSTKSVTLDLAAGHYVIVCNIAGHYSAGMHSALTVA